MKILINATIVCACEKTADVQAELVQHGFVFGADLSLGKVLAPPGWKVMHKSVSSSEAVCPGCMERKLANGEVVAEATSEAERG